ncbi:hypothetical protein E2C01_010875 [Portunus trituberculatus]|uniref:Uncharacterized protein n=1 Tax=Portunus trituberculatus TaxID=210409 RepID=A0A5B7D9K1_PORTR|nr:hypothetical protein [Portunus trituberculatus]
MGQQLTYDRQVTVWVRDQRHGLHQSPHHCQHDLLEDSSNSSNNCMPKKAVHQQRQEARMDHRQEQLGSAPANPKAQVQAGSKVVSPW